ncbi:hypothetical protein [Acidimangrovimonas sediminis]|uniref:hypothetical protein n=1 Tax=Acidimangrovimonas sediminis TaxID=2056283 RepID=UPI0011AEDE6F|nr:hypothetical protein [Acidimangrovimonas sediminis]
MKLSRKVTVVAATFLLAAATGQYMQGGLGPRSGAAPAPPSGPAAKAVAKSGQPAPRLQDATQIDPPHRGGPSARADISDVALRDALPRLSPLSPGLPAALTVAAAPSAPEAVACHDSADLSVGEGAMLNFHLDAPCHPSQRIVIRHAGLAFTEVTDAKGKLRVRLPAMQRDARVTAMFSGGARVSATTTVPELSIYDRVAVQWVGKDSFELHALEFGATFGARGDVSAANPGAPAPQPPASGGFMTVLGNGDVTLPMKAQVYTYPTRLAARDGDVRLVIDAAVTPATCGREMLAETLRTRRDAAPRSTDLSVAMPDCDQSGGFVQLSGLLPEIKMAGN